MILTRDDVAKLRRTAVRVAVPNEVLVPAHTDMQEELARKAIAAICRENILGDGAIEPFELVITEEADFLRNITAMEFRWEPSLDRYNVEFSGGPADGATAQCSESVKGAIRINTQNIPTFGSPIGETRHVLYVEDGWDTESKVWIYTPKLERNQS